MLKPTNHLRWKATYRTVAQNPGVYGDWRTKQEEYKELQQFWVYDSIYDVMAEEAPAFDEELKMHGVWKPIPVTS